MIVIILASVATISGCHRSYYRRQADAEVNRLITEKTADPRCTIPSAKIIRRFHPMIRRRIN